VKATADITTLRKLIGEYRGMGRTIGFVPTMGCLHEGHLSLVDIAGESCDVVVMSIFVNPTQFGPGEDLERYPRDLDSDLLMAEERGVGLVFHPEVSTMYPGGDTLAYIDMPGLTGVLCGASRPGHFRGVMTVVAKLLNIVKPDLAVFGQKDIQQLVVIKRMVRDLNFPVKIVSGPIVRERDGLAMSSRNKYLDGDERVEALRLYRSLLKAKELILDGERISNNILTPMTGILSGKGVRLDYAAIVRYDDLEPMDIIGGRAIIAVAAYVGSTRLIDNLIVEISDDGPSFSI
jgi:pantoate--beta-alanine ligase